MFRHFFFFPEEKKKENGKSLEIRWTRTSNRKGLPEHLFFSPDDHWNLISEGKRRGKEPSISQQKTFVKPFDQYGHQSRQINTNNHFILFVFASSLSFQEHICLIYQKARWCKMNRSVPYDWRIVHLSSAVAATQTCSLSSHAKSRREEGRRREEGKNLPSALADLTERKNREEKREKKSFMFTCTSWVLPASQTHSSA